MNCMCLTQLQTYSISLSLSEETRISCILHFHLTKYLLLHIYKSLVKYSLFPNKINFVPQPMGRTVLSTDQTVFTLN